MWDLYRLENDAGAYALKLGGRSLSKTPLVREASHWVGSVSTVHDVSYTGGQFLNGRGQLHRMRREAPLDVDALADALLGAEADVLERAGPAWNQPFVELSEQDSYGRRRLGLVTQWHEGPHFGASSRSERRTLFPNMLPALWDALSVARHGDLRPEHLIFIEGGRFAIVDPGPQYVLEDPTEMDDCAETRLRFTTNHRYYPVLPPYYAGSATDGGLRSQFSRYLHSMSRWRPPTTPGLGVGVFAGTRGGGLVPPWPTGEAPLAADLQAMGVIYYETLTGCGLGFASVPWVGLRSLDDDITLHAEFIGGVPPIASARVHASDVTAAEAALAHALVHLEVEGRDHLVHLVRETVRSLGAE